MYKQFSIDASAIPSFEDKLTEYAKSFEIACILNRHSETFELANKFAYNEYDLVAGYAKTIKNTQILTGFDDLEKLSGPNTSWYLGYLTYDLKNEIEDLYSGLPDFLNWAPLFYFVPEILFLKKGSTIVCLFNPARFPNYSLEDEFDKVIPKFTPPAVISFSSRISKAEYIDKVNHIQNHIARGDIYEVNFCQEFYSNVEIDPYSVYHSLSKNNPSPFAVFFKLKNKFLLCASPERFLKKKDLHIISQPIKGTSKRSVENETDLENKRFLAENKKEQSENIMIVDLVRNDLSRIAKKGTVKVEELCGIYSFPKVHQMISTISAQLKTQSFKDIIKATFPMGSMTGAPKIEALKIIENFESTKRGLYSGSVGYVTPEGDFDLNVVIRSLQYNSENQYVSYIAGSAITALSDPEMEYEECLLKTYGINQSLQLKNNVE
jgi:para-aminobenzoate synthetase component 1